MWSEAAAKSVLVDRVLKVERDMVLIMIDVLQIENVMVKQLVLGMVSTNCYIVCNQDTKEAVVIDPADSSEQIIAVLKQEGLKLAAILLTHGHFDHVYAASALREKYHVRIYAHKEEKELLEDAHMNYSYEVGRPVFVNADCFVEDKEVLTLAGMKITCIYTPGHTEGSVCYYWNAYRFLLSGDTLFLESLGRTDLPTGSGRKIIESIKNKLFSLEDDIVVFPGHGDKTTIAYEKKNNPYVNEMNDFV